MASPYRETNAQSEVYVNHLERTEEEQIKSTGS